MTTQQNKVVTKNSQMKWHDSQKHEDWSGNLQAKCRQACLSSIVKGNQHQFWSYYLLRWWTCLNTFVTTQQAITLLLAQHSSMSKRKTTTWANVCCKVSCTAVVDTSWFTSVWYPISVLCAMTGMQGQGGKCYSLRKHSRCPWWTQWMQTHSLLNECSLLRCSVRDLTTVL